MLTARAGEPDIQGKTVNIMQKKVSDLENERSEYNKSRNRLFTSINGVEEANKAILLEIQNKSSIFSKYFKELELIPERYKIAIDEYRKARHRFKKFNRQLSSETKNPNVVALSAKVQAIEHELVQMLNNIRQIRQDNSNEIIFVHEIPKLIDEEAKLSGVNDGLASNVSKSLKSPTFLSAKTASHKSSEFDLLSEKVGDCLKFSETVKKSDVTFPSKDFAGIESQITRSNPILDEIERILKKRQKRTKEDLTTRSNISHICSDIGDEGSTTDGIPSALQLRRSELASTNDVQIASILRPGGSKVDVKLVKRSVSLKQLTQPLSAIKGANGSISQLGTETYIDFNQGDSKTPRNLPPMPLTALTNQTFNAAIQSIKERAKQASSFIASGSPKAINCPSKQQNEDDSISIFSNLLSKEFHSDGEARIPHLTLKGACNHLTRSDGRLISQQKQSIEKVYHPKIAENENEQDRGVKEGGGEAKNAKTSAEIARDDKKQQKNRRSKSNSDRDANTQGGDKIEKAPADGQIGHGKKDSAQLEPKTITENTNRSGKTDEEGSIGVGKQAQSNVNNDKNAENIRNNAENENNEITDDKGSNRGKSPNGEKINENVHKNGKEEEIQGQTKEHGQKDNDQSSKTNGVIACDDTNPSQQKMIDDENQFKSKEGVKIEQKSGPASAKDGESSKSDKDKTTKSDEAGNQPNPKTGAGDGLAKPSVLSQSDKEEPGIQSGKETGEKLTKRISHSGSGSKAQVAEDESKDKDINQNNGNPAKDESRPADDNVENRFSSKEANKNQVSLSTKGGKAKAKSMGIENQSNEIQQNASPDNPSGKMRVNPEQNPRYENNSSRQNLEIEFADDPTTESNETPIPRLELKKIVKEQLKSKKKLRKRRATETFPELPSVIENRAEGSHKFSKALSLRSISEDWFHSDGEVIRKSLKRSHSKKQNHLSKSECRFASLAISLTDNDQPSQFSIPLSENANLLCESSDLIGSSNYSNKWAKSLLSSVIHKKLDKTDRQIEISELQLSLMKLDSEILALTEQIESLPHSNLRFEGESFAIIQSTGKSEATLESEASQTALSGKDFESIRGEVSKNTDYLSASVLEEQQLLVAKSNLSDLKEALKNSVESNEVSKGIIQNLEKTIEAIAKSNQVQHPSGKTAAMIKLERTIDQRNNQLSILTENNEKLQEIIKTQTQQIEEAKFQQEVAKRSIAEQHKLKRPDITSLCKELEDNRREERLSREKMKLISLEEGRMEKESDQIISLIGTESILKERETVDKLLKHLGEKKSWFDSGRRDNGARNLIYCFPAEVKLMEADILTINAQLLAIKRKRKILENKILKQISEASQLNLSIPENPSIKAEQFNA